MIYFHFPFPGLVIQLAPGTPGPRLGTLHFVPALPGAIKARQASAVEKSIGFEDFPSYKWFNDFFSIEDDEILIYTS